jgi:hypothetical protein
VWNFHEHQRIRRTHYPFWGFDPRGIRDRYTEYLKKQSQHCAHQLRVLRPHRGELPCRADLEIIHVESGNPADAGSHRVQGTGIAASPAVVK